MYTYNHAELIRKAKHTCWLLPALPPPTASSKVAWFAGCVAPRGWWVRAAVRCARRRRPSLVVEGGDHGAASMA